MTDLFERTRARSRTAASTDGVRTMLRDIIGAEYVLIDPEQIEPYGQDAVKEKFLPEAVLFPRTAEDISRILQLANEVNFPVTARGGGVGYSGGAVPIEGGVVIGTDRMKTIKEIH